MITTKRIQEVLAESQRTPEEIRELMEHYKQRRISLAQARLGKYYTSLVEDRAKAEELSTKKKELTKKVKEMTKAGAGYPAYTGLLNERKKLEAQQGYYSKKSVGRKKALLGENTEDLECIIQLTEELLEYLRTALHNKKVDEDDSYTGNRIL